MKKIIIALCSFFLLLAGCASKRTTGQNDADKLPALQPAHQFQRISLESETLCDELTNYINTDTLVVSEISRNLSTELTVYEIKERIITEEEFQQLQENVLTANSTSGRNTWTLEDNSIIGNFGSFTSGTATMSEEELEVMARKTLNQIHFLEDDYVYYGICGRTTAEDSKGTHTTRIMVTFCRVLDGVRIIGNDRCDMWFNDSGLVGIAIDLFDYEPIGTIDMITQEEAENKVKTPDAFTIETDGNSAANRLQVERFELLLVNQHSKGCSILQPVYVFKGTALLEDGTQAEFSSEVIAIPESYTYKAD